MKAATALLVFAFAAGAAHGIGSTWLWGHDGHNGAAWSQAARNTLRFGVLAPTPYYTGYGSPGPAEVFYRHPPLLHLQIAASFLLVGDRPWAARLPEEPTWCWRWLGSVTRPPAGWADDPKPDEARRAVGLE